MAVVVLARKSHAKAFFILGLCSLLIATGVHGARRKLLSECVFDVLKYEADPSGMVDSTVFFQAAWQAACKSPGPARLVIPKGEFHTGEMNFEGPCTANPITIEIQGTILGDANIGDREAFLISHVNNLVVTGNGTYDGQGAQVWKTEGCGSGECQVLPVSIKFSFLTDTRVENIKLLNAKGFHMTITNCTNFVAQGLTITAPGDSHNTDGIHISRSTNVTITDCCISTGDDCVSIGEGSNCIEVNNVRCGPGHGISVGSLGKVGDSPVSNIHVAHCKLTGTTNGARIKSFHNSPAFEAKNIVFEDMEFDNVSHPVIIDQHYHSNGGNKPSLVHLSDIHFRNIRGTTSTPQAVSLNCSSAAPCEGVELLDIDLKYIGIMNKPFEGGCEHAKATFAGKQCPPPPPTCVV